MESLPHMPHTHAWLEMLQHCRRTHQHSGGRRSKEALLQHVIYNVACPPHRKLLNAQPVNATATILSQPVQKHVP